MLFAYPIRKNAELMFSHFLFDQSPCANPHGLFSCKKREKTTKTSRKSFTKLPDFAKIAAAKGGKRKPRKQKEPQTKTHDMNKYTITANGHTLTVKKNGKFFAGIDRRFRWYTPSFYETFLYFNTDKAQDFESILSEKMLGCIERFSNKAHKGETLAIFVK